MMRGYPPIFFPRTATADQQRDNAFSHSTWRLSHCQSYYYMYTVPYRPISMWHLSMTLNVVYSLFNIIYFGGNRKLTYTILYRPISSAVSEIIRVLYHERHFWDPNFPKGFLGHDSVVSCLGCVNSQHTNSVKRIVYTLFAGNG